MSVRSPSAIEGRYLPPPEMSKRPSGAKQKSVALATATLALTARGQSSPCPAGYEGSVHLKTAVFCGCYAPGTASCGPTRGVSTACSLGFRSFHSHCDSVFPCGCEFSNLHFPDKMKSCRHKERWATSLPMWVRVFQLALCPSRKYPSDSAEEPASEGSFRGQFQPLGKGHQNCKSRRLTGTSVIHASGPEQQ